jgi:citrate lyase gamma subunit
MRELLSDIRFDLKKGFLTGRVYRRHSLKEIAVSDITNLRLILSCILLFIIVSGSYAQSDKTEINDYKFPEQTGAAEIDDDNATVDIEVEYGTDLTQLVAEFKLSRRATAFVNGIEQKSKSSVNDFTDPVVYTVVAEDDETTQDWIVTVTLAPNTATDFLSYNFPEQTGPAEIDAGGHRINIEVAYGTDVRNLVATFELSYGATAWVYFWEQESGVSANNFTNPVTYRVIAEDGSTRQDWRVTVTIAPEPEADIISFEIPGQVGESIIDIDNQSVEITMPYGSDLENLVSNFTLSYGASAEVEGILQESGITPNDFTSPVIYKVLAYDGSLEKDWTITVIELPNNEAEFLSFSLPEQKSEAVIDSQRATIDIEVNFGTDFSNLIATFELSQQATAYINNIEQISGVTENDFSSSVTYIVSAGDNTIKEWTIRVTEGRNSENDFLSYSLPQQIGQTIIDTVNHTISIDMIYGTELNNLIATFALPQQAVTYVEGIEQESGITSNDFNEPITYSVTAGDLSTVEYDIFINILPNNQTDILSFSFEQQFGDAIIDNTNHTVDIEVGYGIDLSNLIAEFTLSPFATAYIGETVQESGVSVNDFSDNVVYTILAGDLVSTQDWEIQVKNKLPSTSADFLSYSVDGQIGEAIIDTINNKIYLAVITETQIDNLVTSFELSYGASAYVNDILQISNVTPNNFTDPVVYTVIAEDNVTQKSWTVYLSIGSEFNYLSSPEEFPMSRESIEVSAISLDYEYIDYATFFYRKVEDEEWSNVSVPGYLGTYRIDLSKEMVGNVGFYYFFEAVDTTGTIISLPKKQLVLYYDLDYPAIPNLRFGETVNQYQIISIPLRLQNTNAEAVFDELEEYNIKNWRLFHYNNGITNEYKKGFTNIDPGLGYWLIVREPTSISTGEGRTVPIDSVTGYQIDLNPGWNQIGNPYDMDINWDAVIIDNQNLNIGRVKQFNRDSLSEGRIIPRYRGGFVFLEGIQPVTVNIKPDIVRNARMGHIADAEKQNALDEISWFASLKVSNGIVSHNLSGIGMHPEAIEGKDRHDEVLLPVPKEIIPFELAFNHPEELYKKFSMDVIQTTDEYIWDFELKSFVQGQTLTISWDTRYFGDNEFNLILNHKGVEKLVNMKEVKSYTFSASGNDQFRIIFGDDSFVNNELKPEALTLGKGYPNPFRHELNIPFTLPENKPKYKVNISVYDITGNLVKQLTNDTYGPGYHTITWNSMEGNGIPGRGIYLIRMIVNSGNNSSVYTRKVIRQ